MPLIGMIYSTLFSHNKYSYFLTWFPDFRTWIIMHHGIQVWWDLSMSIFYTFESLRKIALPSFDCSYWLPIHFLDLFPKPYVQYTRVRNTKKYIRIINMLGVVHQSESGYIYILELIGSYYRMRIMFYRVTFIFFLRIEVLLVVQAVLGVGAAYGVGVLVWSSHDWLLPSSNIPSAMAVLKR